MVEFRRITTQQRIALSDIVAVPCLGAPFDRLGGPG